MLLPLLICYDGSHHARLAVQCAGALLRPREAVVLLLPPCDGAQAARARQVALDAGFEPVAVVKAGHGRIPAAVVRQARRRDASVIVAGASDGAPARSGLLVGLLAHADRPVLTGPRTAAPAAVSEPIVLGYDGSPVARQALAAAGELLTGRAAIVAAFMPAVDEVAVLRQSLPWPAPAEVRDAQARLDRQEAEAPAERAREGTRVATTAGFAARPLGIAGIDASTDEEEEPGRRLVRVAADADAACVVVGHRRSARGVASVAHALVSDAHRPVLVVPDAR